MAVIHPVHCNPVLGVVVNVLNAVGWKAGAGASDLPALADGEFFLTDENGNYLADENGALLTGTNA